MNRPQWLGRRGSKQGSPVLGRAAGCIPQEDLGHRGSKGGTLPARQQQFPIVAPLKNTQSLTTQ